MVKALTIAALLVTITAGSILAYRNQPYSIYIERAGEVKKDQEQPSVARAPAVQAPGSFGPVPNVIVQSMPLPTIQEPVRAPTPAPLKRKPARKHVAANKLHSRWVAPDPKPFDIKDLFK